MPKFMIRRSCWRWYYHGSIRILNCIHLSCQDYSSPEKKHLASVKNTLFMRRGLESECRCNGRHLEEYNQHGVWCWWRQNWCRPFENHDSSSNIFLFLREDKSRLVSRLRFFFVSSFPKMSLMMTKAKHLSNLLSSSAKFAYVCIRVPFFAKYHLFLFLFCDPEFFF